MKQNTPLFRVIYNELINRIENGTYKPGDRIPTEAEWASMYNVSRITSKKALDLAAENHIIIRQRGKGSFVAKKSKNAINKSTERQPVYGIIQHDIADSFGLEIFQTLEKRCHENGILTLAGFSHNDMETEKRLINDFYRFGVDGFIISPIHNETFNYEILKLILDHFPVVLIDRYLKDVSCPNVISKNFEAAREGMNYLYSLGHRNIGIISRNINSVTTLKEREDGVLRSIMENGYPFEQKWWITDLAAVDVKDEETFNKEKNRVKKFLMRNKELTAIFGLKYSAIPVIEVAAHELGLSIPEDLSLMSFDNPGYLVNQIKPMTHLRQNQKMIADTAFETIGKMLAGGEVEPRHEIDVELVIGATTAKID